ncbi:hypothetical protein R8O82_001310 [Escherichia coli]|nr:hypothetical protein [Escherichia coli]
MKLYIDNLIPVFAVLMNIPASTKIGDAKHRVDPLQRYLQQYIGLGDLWHL